MNKASVAGIMASNTRLGATPAIHIIVVVVSPTTLQAPPALEAATIAAMEAMWTYARKSSCAIAPPIKAPAILSRKLERIPTSARSVNTAFPIVRQKPRQKCGQMTAFKVIGEQSKAHQQAEKIRKDDPFVSEMRKQPSKTRPSFEPCKYELVEDHYGQAR